MCDIHDQRRCSERNICPFKIVKHLCSEHKFNPEEEVFSFNGGWWCCYLLFMYITDFKHLLCCVHKCKGRRCLMQKLRWLPFWAPPVRPPKRSGNSSDERENFGLIYKYSLWNLVRLSPVMKCLITWSESTNQSARIYQNYLETVKFNHFSVHNTYKDWKHAKLCMQTRLNLLNVFERPEPSYTLYSCLCLSTILGLAHTLYMYCTYPVSISWRFLTNLLAALQSTQSLC